MNNISASNSSIPQEIESAINNWKNDKSHEKAKDVHLAIKSTNQTNGAILYSKNISSLNERKELAEQMKTTSVL